MNPFQPPANPPTDPVKPDPARVRSAALAVLLILTAGGAWMGLPVPYVTGLFIGAALVAAKVLRTQ